MSTPNEVEVIAEEIANEFDSKLGTNGVIYDELLKNHKSAITAALRVEREAREGAESALVMCKATNPNPQTIIDGLLSEMAELRTRAERAEAELAECKNNLDMYIDKVSDIGMEAQREVLRHMDTRRERDALKSALADAVETLRPFAGIFTAESSLHANTTLAVVRGGPSSFGGFKISHCRHAAELVAKHGRQS